MITHLSDVWSACVTMMIVLVGDGVNLMPHTQVRLYRYILYDD